MRTYRSETRIALPRLFIVSIKYYMVAPPMLFSTPVNVVIALYDRKERVRVFWCLRRNHTTRIS